jgi:hypothetical protein
MACGVACLRMIEKWVRPDAEPLSWRAWLDASIYDEKSRKRNKNSARECHREYLKKGVVWESLLFALEETLGDWINVSERTWHGEPFGSATFADENSTTIVLAKEEFYWPIRGNFENISHYLLFLRSAKVNTGINGEPKQYVCIADPLRTCLVFEPWETLHKPLLKDARELTLKT